MTFDYIKGNEIVLAFAINQTLSPKILMRFIESKLTPSFVMDVIVIALIHSNC